MEPPNVTPEQIIAYGSKKTRPLLLDKNVVAYFGNVFRLQRTNTNPPPYRVVLKLSTPKGGT
jgi:hypothetical protein